MLVYYKVGNYKSIKDPVTLNFNAAPIKEHAESNVLRKGKHDLLRTVLLYGPNAGGKSNILDSLVFFRFFITASATGKMPGDRIPVQPFRLNKETSKEPGFFEAEFILQNTVYRYGFEADSEQVHKEWLLEVRSTTSSPLLLRIGQDFQINEKKIPGATGVDKRTRKNALFLSAAAQWNVQLAEDIVAWFSSVTPLHGMMDKHVAHVTNDLMETETFSSYITEMIRKADFGISDVYTRAVSDHMRSSILENLEGEALEKARLEIEKEKHAVFTVHDVFDNQGNKSGQEIFSMEGLESEGTKKFYNMIGMLFHAVYSGRLIIIDELDARLHTLMTRAIIAMFNAADSPSEAQLLAACHDPSLLDREILRRDQIYFAEKNNLAATTLTSLVEYNVRKESAFAKNYLEGRYGGIPFIDNFVDSIVHGSKETK